MNHLRVDLILDSERRSTSPVSLRFLLRAAGLAAMVILGLLAIALIIRIETTRKKRTSLTAVWDQLEPRLRDVRDLQREVDRLQDILSEIQSWNRARIPWHQHLADFRKLVPETIQVSSILVSDQVLMVGKSAALVYRMDLRGRAEGRTAKEDVDTLLRLLKNGEGFSGMVEEASVETFTMAPGERDHRLFSIVVKYKPRSLQ